MAGSGPRQLRAGAPLPQPGLDLLPQAFCLRPVQVVARDLLGRHLRHGGVVLRITEVEAYGGPDVPPATAARGAPPATRPCGRTGAMATSTSATACTTCSTSSRAAGSRRRCSSAAASRWPAWTWSRRRGGLNGPALLTGPGKVAQALAVDLSFTRHPLVRPGRPGAPGRDAPGRDPGRPPGGGGVRQGTGPAAAAVITRVGRKPLGQPAEDPRAEVNQRVPPRRIHFSRASRC